MFFRPLCRRLNINLRFSSLLNPVFEDVCRHVVFHLTPSREKKTGKLRLHNDFLSEAVLFRPVWNPAAAQEIQSPKRL